MAGVVPRQGPSSDYGENGCGYAVSGDVEGRLCGRPATHHVMWDASGENGSACADHYQWARRCFPTYDSHEWTDLCNMPGCVWVYSWDHPPGCCAMLVDDDTLAAAQAAELQPA